MGLGNCEKLLTSSIGTSCAPISAGILSAIIINRADISGYVAVVGSTNKFSSITRKASKKGFKLQDFRKIPFDGSSYSHEDGTVATKTSKTYGVIMSEAGAEADAKMDELKGGQFVVVLEYAHGGFEIVGKEAPLTITDHTREPAGGDLDGAWQFTLSCSEISSGNYLFDTDYTTTLATYNALLV